jgi:single-strand DNA-binding protein
MLNRVTLIGNLGKDPEVRRLENGTPVAKFTVATNENYKDNAGEWQTLTEWHDVVLWRNNAEIAEKYFKKGTMVFIEGKITHRKYTDKTGIERYATEIVANTCRAFEKRESNGRDSNFPTQESPYAAGRSNMSTSTDAPKTVDFEVVPAHEMADAPNMEGGNDLPF